MASEVILVCGTRSFADQEFIWDALDEYVSDVGPPEKLIAGCADGPDKLALTWARERGIARARYEADWRGHNRAAGPIRNTYMIQDGKPTHTIAFWDGSSTGTLDAITKSVRAGAIVSIIPLKKGGREAFHREAF